MNAELEPLFEAWDHETLDESGRARLNAALDEPEARRAWFEHLHFTAACYELLREAPALAPDAARAAEAAEAPALVRRVEREHNVTPWWLAGAAVVALAAGLLYGLLGRPSLPGTARDQAPVRRSVGGENEKPAPERTPKETTDPALDRLLADLAGEDVEKREAASRALVALGSAALPRLKTELEHAHDPDLRARLKEALDAIGTIILTVEGGNESTLEFRYLHDLLKRAQFPTVTARDTGIVDLGTSQLAVAPECKRSERSQLPVLDEFDVVILGDIDPDLALGKQGQEELKSFVENGGGLVLIAGHKVNSPAYEKGPLAELLPVEPGRPRPGDAAVPREAVVVPTSQCKNHPLLALSIDEKANKAAWDTFPKKLWIAPVARAKPKALVLLSESDKAETPVLAVMRYGKGAVVYLGTDNLWRWRRDGGEAYYELFYRKLFECLHHRPAPQK